MPRRPGTLLLLTLSFPSVAGAQGFQLSGRVFSVIGADTLALPQHWVVLHEVTAAAGRAVDSVRTDPSGVYFLRAPTRDTAAVYMSSVTFRTIAYFSSPVRSGEFTTDTAAALFVFDTSIVGPPIVLRQRHVVVRAPEEDGSRSVLELIVLENRGSLTRIANDAAAPVWQEALPPGAFNLEVAPSDVSAEAVYRRGDSVALSAAVPPGESNQKQIVFGYILPRGMRRFMVPIDQPIERFQVLIEGDGVEMLSGPLEPRGIEQLDNISFARFEAVNVAGGGQVSFLFSGPQRTVAVLLWVIFAISGTAMVAVFIVWLRKTELHAAEGERVDALAARVAALDQTFTALGANATEAERQGYIAKRADLKARLIEALARRRSA